VPGSFTIRLPQLPLSGVFLCAWSNEIRLAGQPASISFLRMSSATCFSWPEIPGIFRRSRTFFCAFVKSILDMFDEAGVRHLDKPLVFVRVVFF